MENEFWKDSPFGENSIFHPSWDFKKSDSFILQISITKKPIDFGGTLEFTITTNLPKGEKLDVTINDIDSILSNKPDQKKDSELYKTVFTIVDTKNSFSITFNNAMEKIAFKDTEGDFAECYIKIENVKIDAVFSEVFKVMEGNTADAMIKAADYTPSWMKEDNILRSNKCYCNRDFSVKEFKDIVLQLRKKEIYLEKQKVLRDSTGKAILKEGKKQMLDITQFDELGEKLFHLDYPEKINRSEANFETFTKALNKALKKYEINTCIRKIHFLAQCYHETQRFTLSYEKSPNSSVRGGQFYRGRGLIQLTHDDNYKNFQQSLNNLETIEDFVPSVAKEIELACEASGYYWKKIGAKKGNISQFADKDDILTVSQEINGYGLATPNGFNDRKLFTNLLKDIMNYDSCIKNK
jgi:predicted chitinase